VLVLIAYFAWLIVHTRGKTYLIVRQDVGEHIYDVRFCVVLGLDVFSRPI
jgi:hypothetical protein